jgi:hypothetical protein
MFLYAMSGAAAGIANAEDRHQCQIYEYLSRAASFIGNAATAHPNEFVIAISAIFTAIFTFVLAMRTSGLFKETAGLREETAVLAKFAKQQAGDMKASIAAAETSAAATEKAAAAATRSADLAEDAFRRLERPYLLVKITETVKLRHPEGAHPNLEYRLVNYGKLPAILRSLSISLQYNPTFPLRTPMAIAETRYEVIEAGGELLNPKTSVVVDSNRGDSFQGQKASLLILHGLIQYEDPTGAFHTDSFCMRGLPGAASFTIDGGDQYNWHETEYQPPRPHRVRGAPRE